MRITELLSKESIALGVKVDSKDAAIDYLVNPVSYTHLTLPTILLV